MEADGQRKMFGGVLASGGYLVQGFGVADALSMAWRVAGNSQFMVKDSLTFV
jgi:transketolase N-terminal domain/subunit